MCFGACFSTWVPLGAVEEMLQQLQGIFCFGMSVKKLIYVEGFGLKTWENGR